MRDSPGKRERRRIQHTINGVAIRMESEMIVAEELADERMEGAAMECGYLLTI